MRLYRILILTDEGLSLVLNLMGTKASVRKAAAERCVARNINVRMMSISPMMASTVY